MNNHIPKKYNRDFMEVYIIKKILCLLVSFIIIVSFVSCGLKNEKLESTVIISETSDVMISIKKDSITSKGLILFITNKTLTDFSRGEDFILELKQDEKWYEINSEQAFSAMAWVLPANSTVEFHATWMEYLVKTGDYRIIKPMQTYTGVQYLSAEFMV